MAQPTHTKVAALPEHVAATKAFLTLNDGISRREGWREGEAFANFLYAGQSALASPLFRDRAPERFEKSEARYFSVLRQCREPTQTMADYARMLSVLILALEAAPTDFLGPIFCEIASSDRAGQFFTPFSLSEMIARMCLQDAPAMLADCRARGRSYMLLQEPACGSGGMALAGNKVLREKGIFIETEAHWVCIDTDPRCVAMTFLQLTLTGCSASVVHGNTLSLEVWDETPTFASFMFPKRRPVGAEPGALAIEGPKPGAPPRAKTSNDILERRARWLSAARQLDLGF